MIRLQPSELTLTPDDVDDTFRRIAQRQALRAQTQTLTSPQKAARLGRPLLRRGPQRSTQNAITTLGNSPVLPPQPQQAIHTSVHDDIHDGPSSEKTLLPACTSPPAEEKKSTSTLSTLNLPFRLGSTQTSFNQRPGEIIVSPPVNSSHHVITPLAEASTANHSTEASPQPSPAVAETSAELRGGGKSGRKRPNTTATNTSHSSPPHDMARSQESPEESQPTKFLAGYFKDPSTPPIGIEYHFDEYNLPMPRTEPRRSSNRHPLLMRSLSSGSTPAFALPPQQRGASRSSDAAILSRMPMAQPSVGPSRSSSIVFTRRDYPSPPPVVNNVNAAYFQNDPARARPRHISSEESNASAAFSYYGSELLESRHSSSDRSSRNELGLPQYDGTAAFRHISRNPFNIQPVGGNISNYHSRPASSRSSGHSLPNLALSNQGGISPLPSVPYTRVQSVQTLVQTSSGFTRRISTSDSYVDASTAAARDLPSPLDDYSEQYQRLLRSQRMRQTILPRPIPFQHQSNTVDMSSLRQRSERYNQDIFHRPPGLQTPAARQLQHSLLRPTRPSSEHRPIPPSQTLQSAGMGSNTTRAAQRSSENSPFTSPSNEDRIVHNNGQVQVHRAAYELLYAAQATQARQIEHGAPGESHRYMPRDISNRPRVQAPYQNVPRNQRRSPIVETSSSPQLPVDTRQVARGEPTTQTGTTGLSPSILPNIPIRHGQRLTDRERLHHTLTQSYQHGPTNTLPSLHLPPTRNNALTSLALDHGHGTTSRRSRSPLSRTSTSARTHRRVPMHQQNQENSAEVENAMMRREESAIDSRYAEDEQRDVMDETPPRIGRVERRMLE